MKIYKYTLALGVNVLPLPEGAQPLTVQMQDGYPQLWALVDPSARKLERKVYSVGTGQLMPRSKLHASYFANMYLATVQFPDGTVWHYFIGVS